MSNLEQLNLYFAMFGRKTFIEGNNLKNIINYLPQLNKFMFNVRSSIPVEYQINLPSNEDIQYTFKDFKNNQSISIDYFPEAKDVQCHIYSHPYIWKDYKNITNSFSGGLFKCVREVLLFDERPFDHEFFLRITQSFPFLKKITYNFHPKSVDISLAEVFCYMFLKTRTCVEKLKPDKNFVFRW